MGEHKAQVNPSGVSLGKKGKGMHMAYRLNCEGLVIQIANRSTCNGNAPNVVIRADGMQCLERGARGCLDLGMAIIQGAGGTIHQKKLSRVDMCLDLPGVGMEDFIAAYKEQRYICRANNRGYMESNGVTLYLGKHPLQLRIYDKVAQLVMANDPLKFMLMKERRWHGDTTI